MTQDADDKTTTSTSSKPAAAAAAAPTAEPQRIWPVGPPRERPRAPDVCLLHFNDVYHLDAASSEPVGGLTRFMTVMKECREKAEKGDGPRPLTIFSGDAFNPCSESCVTKGMHMVTVLDAIGTDAACMGNHDLDFGVKQFEYLTQRCHFPWLLANVFDPALGERVPLGHARRTHMLTASNGIKVGLIGIVERDWLDVINGLPPGVVFVPAADAVRELAPVLRAQGADMVVCVNHQREGNDAALADAIGGEGGVVDIILGGHDHYYKHEFRNGLHVLRSGTEFRHISLVEAWRRDPRDDAAGGSHPGGGGGSSSSSSSSSRWEFSIVRRDIVSRIAEDPPTARLVADLTSKLHRSFMLPLGWTLTPLDARSSTVRSRESSLGNLICDMIRAYHRCDCVLVSGGIFRGDRVLAPGVIRLMDVLSWFPIENPIVLLRVAGRALLEAVENGVSLLPALKGRFPQVAGMAFECDAGRQPGGRITRLEIGGEPVDVRKEYTVATTSFIAEGKDGYTSLLGESHGGKAKEIIDEERGVLISTMLRQYFMALRTVNQWDRLSDTWQGVAASCAPAHTPGGDSRSKDEKTKNSESHDDKKNNEGNIDKTKIGGDNTGKPPQLTLRRGLGAPPAPAPISNNNSNDNNNNNNNNSGSAWDDFHRQRIGHGQVPPEEDDVYDNDAFDPPSSSGEGKREDAGKDKGLDEGKDRKGGEDSARERGRPGDAVNMQRELFLMRHVIVVWAKKAGVKLEKVADPMREEDCEVDWTRVISPAVDGRIVMVGA